MNSQVNNQNDNQEVFKEDQFRPVFFDKSSGGGQATTSSGPAEEKRVRLDASINKDENMSPTTKQIPVMNPLSRKQSHSSHMNALARTHTVRTHNLLGHTSNTSKQHTHPFGLGNSKRKAPKFIRKFRSRSLPIINYAKPGHIQHLQNFPKIAHTSVPPLPPINLQSLKEIDLHEILKNPQLRHDIVFDPQLQFRPNLDGERGKRKKSIIDKYWGEIEKECSQFFADSQSHNMIKISRLPILVTTLRDILLSLLPYKDRSSVNEVMDIELLIQQLSHGSFDFVALSQWLGEVFKSHCAPMRDQWVADMINKFRLAFTDNSVKYLVQGLRMIFSILEAMKLDVANHQIRILRPVLIETAVDFEKDYFHQLILNSKIDISDSLKWFYKSYHKKCDKLVKLLPNDVSDEEQKKFLLSSSIIDLLSCRNMATEFPSTLAFDHTRLVLLRADVRQLVCVQLCIVLYKQLLINYPQASSYRSESFKPANINKIQEELLAIVRDDNGNVKWTRNIQSIALQLVKNAVTDPLTGKSDELPQAMVTFANGWLIKQIQPVSEVYGLMEEKIFKDLFVEVINSSKASAASSAIATKNVSEMSSIANRIYALVKFHWSVFGNYYSDYFDENK
ncbi:DEHA2G10604p [Debaryomyces hansenii CBS767]|uniref:DEHA2G10604p n=1 Tax=Debaryomyces hansenii (strain ATCC 36239 / CBS 767 / BCRC 21394 / JCM 1990 / NBRC 0083 / IGC 2968) TaxID=284592 RepID=Q6BIG7_DEBHA|nr:DEHA2G10604p [Debaryomyces hansenii CBS767]CAG90483.2 DEHA2G10604p [Debaryomyces hansenii CBS767]|eukprot:XP_462004.2 DEHA2G10604p [Debaryomyces hansenii CBS767]